MEPNDKRLIEIVERMPDNLTDMQKVRYVYMEVCRFFVYNPEYVTGDSKKKEELFNQDVDIRAMMGNKAICSSLSRAVIYLLKELGIECNGVYFNVRREGHLEVIVGVDGEIYELDPARDLMNVKMGFQTEGFAKKMYQRSNEDFWGYSELTDEQIKKLDDAIGYTYGLSSEYIDKIKNRGESVEDYNFTMYMDEAVEEIGNALYNIDLLNEYIKSIHPSVDTDALSDQDYDEYRIEFVMQYVNNFAKNHSYMDRRDFFEKLVRNTMDIDDDTFQLFSGTDIQGDLYTIAKYRGEISEADLFYLIREGQDIRQLDVEEVKELLDNGFKTISKGKEKNLLSKDGQFKSTTFDFGCEINLYIEEAESEEEMIEREAEVYAALMLQKVREGIALYKEAIYYSKDNPDSSKKVSFIYDEFVKFMREHEYDGIFSTEDLSNPEIGFSHLLENMEKLESKLIEEAGPVLQIIEDYKQALKDEAIANNYMLYHISTKSPEEMEDGVLKPHYEKTQFGQHFGKILCGSTESVKTNAYILSRVNGDGMYRLPVGKHSYLLKGHGVSVVQGEDGSKRVVSKKPGYIYYLPIDEFEPVIMLKYNRHKNEYSFLFEEEWVTDKEIAIPKEVTEHLGELGDTKKNPDNEGNREVFSIEKYNDVTSILEHNQFIINNELGQNAINMLVKNIQVNMHIVHRIIAYIRDKQVTYLNGEAGINVHRDAAEASKLPQISYTADAILHGPSVVTTDEVSAQKHRIRDFVENALRKKNITYVDYMRIMSMKLPDDNEKNKKDKD